MLTTLGQLPIGWLLFAVLAAAGFLAFYIGRTEIAQYHYNSNGSGPVRLHSQPNYHGYYLAICTVLPAAAIFILYMLVGENYVHSVIRGELPDWTSRMGELELDQYLARVSEHAHMRKPPPTGNLLFDAASQRFAIVSGQARLIATLLALMAAFGGFFFARRAIGPEFRARVFAESWISVLLFMCAALATVTTVGIVASLVFETIQFFSSDDGPTIPGFLFGLEWNAQTGESFGAIPLFFGTLMIAFLAMCVAAPVGLFSAIYLSEYASQPTRAWVKPLLEVLAGIPTVVYGFFAMLVVAPGVRSFAQWFNGLPFIPDGLLAAQPTSALAAGLVMGIMIIPFVSSLSDDVINAVPQSLRDGALAIGSTQAETIKQVVLPAALPGVTAALLLAISRAIGETMIVVMAAGQRAQITADPTSDLTTITVQIVSLLTGDTEFDSAKTLSAFALGFVLFVITLCFNLIALRVVQRYREKYD